MIEDPKPFLIPCLDNCWLLVQVRSPCSHRSCLLASSRLCHLARAPPTSQKGLEVGLAHYYYGERHKHSRTIRKTIMVATQAACWDPHKQHHLWGLSCASPTANSRGSAKLEPCSPLLCVRDGVVETGATLRWTQSFRSGTPGHLYNEICLGSRKRVFPSGYESIGEQTSQTTSSNPFLKPLPPLPRRLPQLGAQCPKYIFCMIQSSPTG